MGITRSKQMQSLLYNESVSIVYLCSDEGVYALIDDNNDQQNDAIHRILAPIERSCTSVAIDKANDVLYITEWEKTYKCMTSNDSLYMDIHEHVLEDPEHNIASLCELWFEQEYYPYHGWHLTEMNAQNQLCIAEGAACNLCGT